MAAGARGSASTAVRDYLDALLAASLIALFVATFVMRTYSIPSVSMVPTLRVGDVVLVDALAYRLHAPQFGDLAVFAPPISAHGDDFIKRVIAVPGDTLHIAGGLVYRNGAALNEPYVNQPPRYELAVRNYGIYVNGVALDHRAADIPPQAAWQSPDRVPKGFYLMLGDNRNYSEDSHVWGFAQVRGRFAAGPLANAHQPAAFAGRAFAVIWPPNRMAAIR